jgi:hypothetical protein
MGGESGLFDSDLGRRNGHPNWVPVERAYVSARKSDVSVSIRSLV